MDHKITFIEGDGIGPEVSNAARRCIEAVAERNDISITWDRQYAGLSAQKDTGSLLPSKTIDSIRRNRVALKGPLTTPIGSGFRSINVELRQRLSLFANVRPSRSIKGAPSRYEDVNLVVIRENSEDLYNGIEFAEGSRMASSLSKIAKKNLGRAVAHGSAIAFKTISKSGSSRIFDFAFDYAKHNKRKKITAVHKANILKFTDGLFIKCGESVAKRHGSIKYGEMIVDDVCAHLVMRPEEFDILVCPNLYGDIISDLCAGLVGGPGLAPSGNMGRDAAIFEPVHGSAPKHAGKNEANPTASILSGVMMLHHVGEAKAAKSLESATMKVIKANKRVTYDLKSRNPSTTTEMTDAIISEIG
ncbi:MAG: isocitrate/isopropylmalate dehydrogenase family protein [Candidatus Micrarchaeota archaeon]|nr:isocitrate/isopropylmalate dehydrogenase family protein [Candidatus Micrarchaeota archaeon]